MVLKPFTTSKMLNHKHIQEAETSVKRYLEEGLLKKEKNETAQTMYLENSELSLETAQKLLTLESPTFKPYLWITVTSYYAMYYVANTALLHLGYKVGEKISHEITADALIVFVRNQLKKELLEEYEDTQQDALTITAAKADALLESFDHERRKRSKFQYQMDEQIKREKSLTSLERAKRFIFEMKKLL